MNDIKLKVAIAACRSFGYRLSRNINEESEDYKLLLDYGFLENDDSGMLDGDKIAAWLENLDEGKKK